MWWLKVYLTLLIVMGILINFGKAVYGPDEETIKRARNVRAIAFLLNIPPLIYVLLMWLKEKP